jgi:histidinol-phosphatase (PHP family)
MGQKELSEKYSQAEIEEIYYNLIYKTIENGGFDVLAHLDFPKRYYGESKVGPKTLSRILKLLIEKDIALEINTSSIRKGLKESMPSISIVEEYVQLGGKKLTLGSDAHIAEDVGADFEDVISRLSETAVNLIGIFKERKFVKLRC